MSMAPIDFNLHNLVGLRLLNAQRGDVAAVTRQLGPIGVPPQPPLERPPEITIRFTDEPQEGPTGVGPELSYVELNRSGFTDEQFFVLRGKHKTPARVQIPLAQVGGCCEIVCQHGVTAVPFLIPILNLTALANGALPLHAGAFVHKGTGVLVTGWSKGGKTEALLGFMARGATYVADEWTYLHDGGRRMSGIPEPVRVWQWHLREMPQYRNRLHRGEQLRLVALDAAARVLEWTAARNGRRLPLFHRLGPLLKKQQGLNVPPQRLFGQAGSTAGSASVDRLFFVVSSASPHVKVEAIDALEVARRMVFSLQEEQRQLLSLYRQFRFAFPHTANTLIDCSEQIQARRLQEMLAGKEAYAVYHPYPVPIKKMVTAMERVLS